MGHPLLLHGFTGSARSWEGVLEGLSSAGHTPVLYDFPGHGRNAGDADPERFTLTSVLAGLRSATDPPADVVGYSMGGRLALHLALADPAAVGRLVLESASPGLATERERAERREADQELARRLREQGIEAFVAAWERLPLFESQRRLDPGVLQRQRERRLANHPDSLALALEGLGTGALPTVWDRLGEVECPVLLLAGAEDRKFVRIGEQMAERLPRARLVVVRGAGHAVHLERPDAWLSLVTGFLQDGTP